MKRSYLSLLAGAVVAMAWVMTACQTPETPDEPVNPGDKPGNEVVEPNFPEKIVANVAPGENFKFTIEPNMDWELSIPLEVASYFKLLDGESSRFTLYGEAGKHEITVQVAEKEEFDTPRVCVVTLKMDGQEQVIAELTRAAKERSVEAFAAEFDATEEAFVENVEGGWSYSTEAMQNFDFVWCNSQWMQRLAVDANFKWTLRGAPEWMIITALNDKGENKIFTGSGKAGRTELFIRIDEELYPLADEQFTLSFCDISDANGDGQITEDDVRTFGSLEGTLAGCQNDLTVELESTINFNDKGLYYQSMSGSEYDIVNATIKAPKGAAIHKVALLADGSASVEESDTAWVTITEEEWPAESQGVGLWLHHFSIEVAENTILSERSAQIIILPKPVAEQLGGKDNLIEGGAIKEQYAQYIASTITQDAVSLENDTIVPYEEGVMAAFNATFQTMPEGMWPWMGDWAEIPNAYKLTYKSNESTGDLVFTFPFESYEIYGFDAKTKYEDTDKCWIRIVKVDDNPRGEEHCYRIEMRLGEEYPNTLAGPDGENEATFVFYDASGVAYAMIYCVMDPTLSTITGAEGDVKFANPTDAATKGAVLEVMAPEDESYDKDMAAHGTLQYRLYLTPKSKSIALILPEYAMVWSYNSAITTEQSADGKYTYVNVDSDKSVTGNISYYKPNDPDNSIAVQLQVVYTVE